MNNQKLGRLLGQMMPLSILLFLVLSVGGPSVAEDQKSARPNDFSEDDGVSGYFYELSHNFSREQAEKAAHINKMYPADSTLPSVTGSQNGLTWSWNQGTLTVSGCLVGDVRFFNLESSSLQVLRGEYCLVSIPLEVLGGLPPSSEHFVLIGSQGALPYATSELLAYTVALDYRLTNGLAQQR